MEKNEKRTRYLEISKRLLERRGEKEGKVLRRDGDTRFATMYSFFVSVKKINATNEM